MRLVAGLGRAGGGPSTADRFRRGPDLIDLIRLVGAGPAPTAEGVREAGAGVVVFETLCVPGPLRTAAYALALGDGDAGDGQRTAVRYFVHEAALHAEVGDADVMAGQCEALAEAAREAAVRLVPFRAGHGGRLRSSFTEPWGGPRGGLLERIALDVPASIDAFRVRAGSYRARGGPADTAARGRT
ncbi:hypothetical protein CKY47_15155 [Saccharothrix yanglingensis]|uniref:DUF5753 domain-containing protein n=1 Tax=Saccharothrix yanglingensis TaxID=659496 RepID=A0ABU0WZQ9_9PSEU|nr:hypothetical protein [Saccharothrix yanglingensis]